MLNGIFAAGLGIGTIFAMFIFWSLVWKGFALWISAREQKKWWFFVLLILNTAGVLEIIYIFGFSQWGKDYFAKRRERILERRKYKGAKATTASTVNKCDDCGHEEGECKCDCHDEHKKD